MSIFDINIQATPEIWAGLWKILREKKIFTAESVHKRKDGTLFPVEISSSYVKFGDQEYCNGFARDITDRKRSEDALKESEETLRVLLNSIPERAFLLDPAYNFIAVNQTVLNGLNKQTGDLIGKYALSFVPPQIAETRKKYFDQVNNTGQPVSFEDSNGGRDYINYISPIMDASGKIASIAVFAFDITERKRAEEALRESEERFRLTFDQSPIGAAIIDLDYRYVKANEELCHFLGYTEEELKMMTFRDTTHPDDLEDDMEMVKRLQKGEIEQYIKDKRYICKDGKTVWGHVSITIMKEPSGKPIYYLGMVENISERKTAEETIRESEARFRLTFDQSPIGAALSTLDYRFIRVNEELCRFLGYSAEEFKNLTFKDITHPEEVGRDAEQIRRLQAGEIEQYIIDKRYIRKDGKIVWGHLSISMLKDAAGKPIYFLPMIEDISERKRAQTALEESEELYRGLISAVPDIIVRTDINGLIIYTNEVVLQNWGGINTREFVGKNIFELIEPSEKEKAIENSRLMVEKSIGPREYKLVLSGDVKIDFEVNGDVLCGTDGKPYGFVYIVRDITERKLSEEKLHTSLKEKEALLRELYHRTKNNMQVIIALLQLHASKADSQTKSVFREMSDRIQSMALVHQKLYQSRNLASIDFREYISDLADLLMASYSIKEEKIKLILDVEKLLVQIDLAIPCGLILSELVSNSLKHAFPDERNGEIRISLHKTQNNIIELIVADNGVGVPDGFDFRNSVKMGIQSVYAVGEHQLRGEVQFESRGGVTCTLRFNEYDQDKA